jgi:hypothetical protein
MDMSRGEFAGPHLPRALERLNIAHPLTTLPAACQETKGTAAVNESKTIAGNKIDPNCSIGILLSF